MDVAVRSQATQVSVSLRDTGEGIAAEDLPHIFERYWSHSNVAGPTSQPGTSAGLELAIVYRILALHGSRIGVQSRPQYGTEFIFSLPLAA